MIRTVTVTERGTTDVELTREQAVELQALGFCSVTPTGVPGVWRVGDVTKVGVAALPGIRVVIRPKTSLENILFMTSYAGEQVALGRRFSFGADDGVPTALAAAFSHAVDVSTRAGLIKGYLSIEETGPVVRGRWDIARQIRQRPGIPLPLELTVDDFTEDILENQLLRTAIARLIRVDAIPEELRKRLASQLVAFADVSPLRPGAIPKIPITRLNERYRLAMTLARVILESTSWASRRGVHEGATFLLGMPLVFERFVARVLADDLRAGFAVSAQDTAHTLDTGGRVQLRPDIVIRRGPRVVGVADTKYKVWGRGSGSPPNGDVYQAVAYALATGVSRAHLIYVSGDIEPVEYEIPTAGVTVVAHALPLGGDPQELADAVRRLGQGLVE